ncbi:MAG: rRNA maturation RNase YbeY [Nitrospirae bacterium]|nr:rRNA maturation RNase YbeY [Nitrospirota bacterium]
MIIEVKNSQRKFRVNLKKIKADAYKILSLCRTGETELSILIVNNGFMRILNRQYRGIDKPTDVLSFIPSTPTHMVKTVPEDGKSGRFLGDIVLSMEKIHSQAAERGHSTDKEFRILLIHGILHLLGYDHEISQKEARRMKRKEKIILSGLQDA